MTDALPQDSEPVIYAVPFKKATGMSMLGSSLLIGAFSGQQLYRGSTHNTPFNVILGIGFGGIALAFLAFAIGFLRRKEPVLAVTRRGITSTIFGKAQAFVPWDQFAGVEVIGVAGEKQLVVTVLDVEAAMSGVTATLQNGVRKQNKKHGLPGAIYIHRNMSLVPLEEAAARVRSIAVEQLEESAATGVPATPTAACSPPSPPAPTQAPSAPAH